MKAHKALGFTLVELAIIIAVLGLLAATLAHGLSGTKTNGQSTRCLNNLHQLTQAWTMYTSDKNDRVVNNFGIPSIESASAGKRFDNWVNNIMTWGASSSVDDVSNTNVNWVKNGLLGSYTGGLVRLYKCTADNFLSPQQIRADFPQRNRSFSMSSLFGRFGGYPDPTASGVNWASPQYRQYLKQSQVPKPAKTWLLIEEQPASINDGYFLNSPLASGWEDIPATYHHGATGFSFIDGHCELRKWRSSTSEYAVSFSYFQKPFDALGRVDFAWFLEHSGYLDAQTGRPLFNY